MGYQRHPPGRAGIMANKKFEEQSRQQGEALNADVLRQMREQLAVFRRELEKFAVQHKDDIQHDPVFRAKFHDMCNKLNVDPLTSRKGAWANLLGLGDFYYELGVQIIEVCLATRNINGGILALKELLSTLRARRSATREDITESDIERAVKKLEILGSGFRILDIGSERIVRSVPLELSMDHTAVLNLCREKGCITHAEAKCSLGWIDSRIQASLDFLLQKELAWLDTQSPNGTAYWVLGFIRGSSR